MKKRMMTLLALVLVLSLIPVPAYAASDEAVSAADALYELGLFNGTGTDASGKPIFELDRAPTRNEAITMLVRLLGKEEEATSKGWDTPFTDVAAWAKPYVGYAYANGLTTGDSATSFGGGKAVTPSQYITFVLRALGYKDGADFQWDKAWGLSDELGFTDGRYDADTTNFTRGDVAVISYNALSAKVKGTGTSLLEKVKGSKADAGEHTHDYIEKTVPGTGGHYERVQVGTEQVLVRNEKRQYYECLHCRAHLYSYEEWEAHTDPETSSCLPGNNLIRTEYVPIYEEKPVYENKWVEDPPTTIHVCEICGQQAPE